MSSNKIQQQLLAIALTLTLTLTAAWAKSSDRSGKEVVEAVCSSCHKSGANGAPKIGDQQAWIPRAVNGMDALVRSAINGHGGMPARGGMANLTDAEMRNAVITMFDQSIKAAQ